MNENAALEKILHAREERAWLQSWLLDGVAGDGCVVQVSLNIPGYPKFLAGDEKAVHLAGQCLTEKIGRRPCAAIGLRHAAGCAQVMLFRDLAAETAKRMAIEIEERTAWGRVLDIDVIAAGGNISREAYGYPPRACLICGGPAKNCARSRAHSPDSVRAAAARLLWGNYSA